jgi:hypothetical protein
MYLRTLRRFRHAIKTCACNVLERYMAEEVKGAKFLREMRCISLLAGIVQTDCRDPLSFSWTLDFGIMNCTITWATGRH